MQRSHFHFLLLFGAFAFLPFASPVFGQQLEPRAYANLPVGLNFTALGSVYSAGGVLFDPAVPLDNANITIHASALGYVRSIKVGNMSGKVDAVLPYAWLSGTADFQGQPVSRVVSGIADPSIRMSVNFIGAPALSLAEFRDYKQNLTVGASLQVFMPLSQYDPEKLVNIGTNRFSFKPELGISKTLGKIFLELATGVTLYTTNHDFYGGKTRSQEPIGSVQGHVIYTIKPGMWAAFNGTYYWGGQTTLDGVEGNDLQKNTRMGLTFALPLNMHNSLKFNFSTGVSTRTGSDFNAVGVVWIYRWGKGFPKAH